jgi:adenylate kinase family enzyme
MAQKLIIIRGNAGSGKSTIAKRLHTKMKGNTMLIERDIIKHDMLDVKDREFNHAIELIRHIATFGKSIGYNVIIEGRMTNERYGAMLKDISELFDETHAFFFDISFEETQRRHRGRDKNDWYDESLLKKWWHGTDLLSWIHEEIITEEMSADEIYGRIIEVIGLEE